MIPPEALIGALADQGLWIVGLGSVVEGPIVAVLASFLASKGVFALGPLAAVLLAGDLLGDLGYYLIGRRGIGRVPAHWRQRLGLGPGRAEALVRHFDRHGGWTLVAAKLTHSIGAPVLVAAGIARMPLAPFLLFNLLASIPKTAALMALGWFAGDAYARIDLWLGRGALVLLLVAAVGAAWLWRRRLCPQD